MTSEGSDSQVYFADSPDSGDSKRSAVYLLGSSFLWLLILLLMPFRRQESRQFLQMRKFFKCIIHRVRRQNRFGLHFHAFL
jgi:hypothetical protein